MALHFLIFSASVAPLSYRPLSYKKIRVFVPRHPPLLTSSLHDTALLHDHNFDRDEEILIIKSSGFKCTDDRERAEDKINIQACLFGDA